MPVFMLVVVASPGSEELSSAPRGPEDVMLSLGTVVAWLSMLITGAILSILRPRNPIGWLLLVSGACLILTNFAPTYAEAAVILGWSLPGYQLLDWLQPAFERLGSLLFIVWIPLLFPDGQLVGARWRPIAWAAVLLIPIFIALTFLTDNDDEFGRTLPNPTALGGAAEEVAETVVSIMEVTLVGFIVLAFVSVIVRFRRSRGAARQQMKWFLGAVGLLFASQISTVVSWLLGAELLANSFYFAAELARGLVPIAIGIAVLRYRLYEIDRIISRTIGWALVTLLLVGSFVGLVLASTAVLEAITGGNTLAVAGSTLVVAALFTPLRSRVQRAVDRRFDRARYDGERLIGAFGERLRDEVDLETIRSDILGTVDQAVRPAGVGLWLRERQGGGR